MLSETVKQKKVNVTVISRVIISNLIISSLKIQFFVLFLIERVRVLVFLVLSKLVLDYLI